MRMKDGFEVSFEASVDRLNRFRCSAVVDRIDVEVWSDRKTQARHLQNRLANAGCFHCSACDREGHSFLAKFNEIRSFSSLMDGLSEAGIDMQKSMPVSRVEVAIDAWPRTAGDEDAMQGLFCESVICLGENWVNPRFVRGRASEKDVRFLDKYAELRTLIAQGYTFYAGNRADPLSFKIYLKKTDNGQCLPKDQWRLRHELTFKRLRGADGELLGWHDFRFEKLAKLLPVLCFRGSQEIRGAASANRKFSGEMMLALGRQHVELLPRLASWTTPAMAGARRRKSRLLQANKFAQARMVYEPLRALSRRWAA